MCTPYLYEVANDVCFQKSIENNIFVITNKGKVVYIRPPKPSAYVGAIL